jgi:hypothetical protein
VSVFNPAIRCPDWLLPSKSRVASEVGWRFRLLGLARWQPKQQQWKLQQSRKQRQLVEFLSLRIKRLEPQLELWKFQCQPKQQQRTKRLFRPLRPGLNGTAFPATRRGFFCGVDATEPL